MKKFLFPTIILILLSLSFFANAEETLGNSVNFYIETSYDNLKRDQASTTLIKISPRAYWYIDDNWWNGLGENEKKEITKALDSLAEEFEIKIYPVLTENFGSEWNPGIDKDSRTTILIHPMSEEAGGYFNSADEYPKSQVPRSNEREMVYLNALHLKKSLAKSLLAHEFQHLIAFNQKERIYNVSEDIWLNEARSEYVPTLLGYDQDLAGSNLQRRIKNFLDKPYDSLTEWRNVSYDYGVTNLFIQYLVDHYGKDILIDSLKSSKAGIGGLNFALSKGGFKEDFSQIFTDWTIAVLINDCSLSQKYCYLNPSLKNFKLTPLINYLPFIGDSVLSVTNTTKDWAGNWHKFVGGKGVLKLEFAGSPSANFKVPYLIEDSQNNFMVGFLKLDKDQSGTIYISDFGSKNVSLTIIPSLRNKISNFSNLEPSVSFFWSASTVEKTKKEEEVELIKKLLAQVEQLQREIARVQAQIDAILGKKVSCQKFEENLYYGMRNDGRVKCLQEFLKSQGSEIYLEGLVTGNFLSLTKTAVIRFQEKYFEEILAPLGLEKGTGFVGPMTRAKINQLLGW
ncbi:MAG: peptidoglycan-binding domain-containing protein [Candidatus Paceibacterales bacterium]